MPRSPADNTLQIQVPYLPRFLNPLVTHDRVTRRLAMYNLFEPLVLANMSGGVRGHLAVKVETERNGRLFRFHLRPGVMFHDGQPLTPADVKYTLNVLRRKDGPSAEIRRELSDIREIRAISKTAVEVHLRRPNTLFLPFLADIPIVPAHVYARRGIRNGAVNRKPVATGPFVVASRTGVKELVLERNDEYWGRHAGVKKLWIRAIKDPALALAALRNGELDMLTDLYPGYYPEQLKRPRLKQRYKVLRIHPNRSRLMVFNTRRSPTNDRRVRLAVTRLADRHRMVRTIRNNLGQVVSAPLWPLGLWYNRTIHPYSFDTKAASRLLDASGWVKVPKKKFRQRNGWPLELSLLVSRQSRELRKAAQILKKELLQAGIKVEIKLSDFGYMVSMVKKGKFDVALLGLALRQEPDLYHLLHSKGETNIAHYSNLPVDNALLSLRSSVVAASRLPVARRLHRLLHEDVPLVPLYTPIELMVVDRRIRGLANNGRWPKFVSLSLKKRKKN